MELTYDITPEDYIAYNVHWGTTSAIGRTAVRRARWLGPAVIVVFVLMAAILAEHWVARGAYLLTGAPAAIFLVLFMPSRMRAAYAANARKVLAEDVAGALTGPRRLVLDDEGLRVSTPISGGYTRWAGVTDIQVVETAAYVYVAPHAAHIVPRRAFADAAGFDAFVAEVRRHAAEARA